MDFFFGFEGRIGRAAWWGGNVAAGCVFIAAFVLAVVDIAGAVPAPRTAAEIFQSMSATALAGCLALVVVGYWMALALNAKRFHDRGKSGWWNLLAFVPYIGSAWILIECGMLSGKPGRNIYDVERSESSDYDWAATDAKINDMLPRRATAAETPVAAKLAASPSAAPRRSQPVSFGRLR